LGLAAPALQYMKLSVSFTIWLQALLIEKTHANGSYSSSYIRYCLLWCDSPQPEGPISERSNVLNFLVERNSLLVGDRYVRFVSKPDSLLCTRLHGVTSQNTVIWMNSCAWTCITLEHVFCRTMSNIGLACREIVGRSQPPESTNVQSMVDELRRRWQVVLAELTTRRDKWVWLMFISFMLGRISAYHFSVALLSEPDIIISFAGSPILLL
jgi:hypothetical protein